MADIELTCKDCGSTFIFTEGEQAFYEEKGFSNPVRCTECRKQRKNRGRFCSYSDRKRNSKTGEECTNSN